MTPEIDHLIERYARRTVDIDPNLYSLFKPVNLCMYQERHRVLFDLFSRHGLTDPSNVRLLEVGAGSGNNLLEFLRMGFRPQHLSGVELLADRVSVAKSLLPYSLKFTQGDASIHNVTPSSLDIVYQSLVFSSILDDSFQLKLAQRMWNWLRPGGAILWYDFTYNNPYNQDVRGVPLSRIAALFPSARIDHRRVTLAPPLSRALCRFHPSLYTVFNYFTFLRTHLLCWIEKP